MKQCSKCKLLKELSEFSKNSKKQDGYAGICKTCHSEYRKESYIKNKDKELSQVKLYQSHIPKELKIRRKQGRTIESQCKTCGSSVFLTKKENLNNIERCCSKICRKKLRGSVYKVYLAGIQKRALKCNKEFNLDEEFLKDLFEVKQKCKCAITKIPLTLKDIRDTKNTFLDNASLDRIDNNKGYTKDNVQWLALGINYMKLDFDEVELHRILKLIKETTSVAQR